MELFNKTWDVLKLEFDSETGELSHLVYKESNGWIRLVVQSEFVDLGHAIVKLEKPIVHPHENYVIVPRLKDIIIKEKR